MPNPFEFRPALATRAMRCVPEEPGVKVLRQDTRYKTGAWQSEAEEPHLR